MVLLPALTEMNPSFLTLNSFKSFLLTTSLIQGYCVLLHGYFGVLLLHFLINSNKKWWQGFQHIIELTQACCVFGNFIFQIRGYCYTFWVFLKTVKSSDIVRDLLNSLLNRAYFSQTIFFFAGEIHRPSEEMRNKS